ncbi:MAG TPA: Mov34/MPN/PAD-1 family protein [Gemmataceae bacterium]
MSPSTPFRLLLPRALLDGMAVLARWELPAECCGLLAGRPLVGPASRAGPKTSGPARLAGPTGLGPPAPLVGAASRAAPEAQGPARLAGPTGAAVTHCYPLVNALHSPVEFESEPHSMLRAMRDIRKRRLDLLAVYHSHPTSPPIPSRKDVERNWYGPKVMCVIIGLAGPEPDVRAWWLGETGYREAEWEIVDIAEPPGLSRRG